MMIGYAPLGRETFFHKMVAAFRAGQEVTLFGDGIRTPVSAAVAATGLLQIAGSGFEDDVNIAEIDRVVDRLHLGGRDRISLFEIGLLTLQTLGLDDQLAIPVSLWDSYSAQQDTTPLPFRAGAQSAVSGRPFRQRRPRQQPRLRVGLRSAPFAKAA